MTSETEIKRLASERLDKTKLPSNQEEAWRKIHLQDFDPSPFDDTNSKLSSLKIDTSVQGLHCWSFSEAMQKPNVGEMVQQHFKQSLAEAEDYFAWQNMAKWQQGLVVHITQSLDKPLLLRHNSESGVSVIHRTLFLVDAHVRATVLEEFSSHSGDEPDADGEKQACYWNIVGGACVGKNACFRHISQRDYNRKDYHFQRFLFEQMRDSQVVAGIVHAGGRLGKSFCSTRLLEENTSFRGVGVYLGSGQGFHDMEILAEHCAGPSQSSLLYKTVVSEQAHSVFDGKLLIHKGIKQIDSRQMNHNILLGASARAETIPRLVVKNEDVICEHGATVGFLEEDALFYLQSRGINETESLHLLLEGFLAEAMQEFPPNFWQQSQKKFFDNFRQKSA